MDQDLDTLTRDQLIAEVKRLREGIYRESLYTQLPHAPRSDAPYPGR